MHVKCRQMSKVKMYVLWSPVLTEMLACKLPGYLLRGRECFVIAAQHSIIHRWCQGAEKLKSPKPMEMSNGKKAR